MLPTFKNMPTIHNNRQYVVRLRRNVRTALNSVFPYVSFVQWVMQFDGNKRERDRFGLREGVQGVVGRCRAYVCVGWGCGAEEINPGAYLCCTPHSCFCCLPLPAKSHPTATWGPSSKPPGLGPWSSAGGEITHTHKQRALTYFEVIKEHINNLA